MNLTRPVAFWIAVLAAVVVAVVLLREVLLPFVAGMLLAYLLDPLATRLERLGMKRLTATLTIVGLFVVGVTALIILTAPVVVRELAYFIDNFPLYIKSVRDVNPAGRKCIAATKLGGQSVGNVLGPRPPATPRAWVARRPDRPMTGAAYRGHRRTWPPLSS